MRTLVKNLFLKIAPPGIRPWLRDVAEYIPEEWRYGKAYRDALDLFRESEQWDRQTLLAYQEQRLELLIKHAYENVPYYREVFQKRGLTPKDIQSVDDIVKLPYLNKRIVRKRKADLVAANVSAFTRELANTSGSSGAPLSFYMDSTTRAMERALAMRQLQWLGYRKGDPVAYFKVAPFADSRKWHSYYRTPNKLKIAFRTVNDQKLRQIVEMLRDFKPSFISAWPSSLYLLARWMERAGETIPPPKFLITGSENLYPHRREFIERVLRARIADHYGQEESVAVAMQCSHTQGYHVQGEMGVLELRPFRKGLMEIVGTCLHNFAMPFIRYQTGDLTEALQEGCPCGRKQPLLARIIGREADFIVTPERNLVSPLMLNLLFHQLDDIREGQIIQEDYNFLRVKLVGWGTISAETEAAIVRGMREALESSNLTIVVEQVGEIPRTMGCKRPFVISRPAAEERF